MPFQIEKLEARMAFAADLDLFCRAEENQSPVADSSAVTTSLVSETAEKNLTGAERSNGLSSSFTQNNSSGEPAVDPDEDGLLTDSDVRLMLHQLAAYGSGPFVPKLSVPAGRDFASGIDLAVSLEAGTWDASDVNQDGILSPIDLLIVINELNARNASAK